MDVLVLLRLARQFPHSGSIPDEHDLDVGASIGAISSSSSARFSDASVKNENG